MTGDSAKAQEAFQSTVREAALRSARGEPPTDRLWFFRDARWRCLDVNDAGIQAEEIEMERPEISPSSTAQIKRLDPEQLAIWISAAADPQRSALALFYLDEFTLREMLSLIEVKAGEFARLLARGRREFQGWLNAVTPPEEA